MPAPSFVHLRLHSEYSIVDGMLRIVITDDGLDDTARALLAEQVDELMVVSAA